MSIEQVIVFLIIVHVADFEIDDKISQLITRHINEKCILYR